MHFTPIKRFVVKKHLKDYPQIRRRSCKTGNRLSYNRYELTRDDEIDSGESTEKNYESRVCRMLSSTTSKSKGSSNERVVKEEPEYCEYSDSVPTCAILNDFEQGKNYNKYFINSNIEKVLNRFKPKKVTMPRRMRGGRRESYSVTPADILNLGLD